MLTPFAFQVSPDKILQFGNIHIARFSAHYRKCGLHITSENTAEF